MDLSTDSSGSGAARVPLRLVDHDGERAVFVPRWSSAVKVGIAVMVLLVLVCVGLGAQQLAAGSPAYGVVLLVVGLVLAAVLVRKQRATPFTGGLWLSPTTVSTAWGRRRWSMPWDEVDAASCTGDGPDVAVRPRGGGDERVISTHLLVVAPGAVVDLIEAYRNSPTSRPELGQETGLQTAVTLRRAHQGVSFRPVVHGAGPVSRRAMFAGSVLVAAALLLVAAIGRQVTIDDDVLAASVRDQLVAQGLEVSDVTCDGPVNMFEGATQDCVATVDGSDRRVRVRVTAVDGDRVTYSLFERG